MCDGVHVDPASGKHTLLGIFSSLQSTHYPTSYPFMIWFLTLTEVPAGQHRIRISFGPGPTRLLPVIDRPFHSSGPLDRINLINEIRNLVFPQPGDYEILIEVDDDPLLVTSLIVMQ